MQGISAFFVLFSAYYRQQIVLIHNSQNCFRISERTVSLQPNMYSAIAVGAATLGLTFTNKLGKRQILCRNIHSLYIVVVPTSGYAEEAAHLANAVLLFSYIGGVLSIVRFLRFGAKRRSSFCCFDYYAAGTASALAFFLVEAAATANITATTASNISAINCSVPE